MRFVVFPLVNVKLSFSNSRSLSKVFCYNFFIMTRKVKISESCPAMDRARRRAMGSITS
jgi:hypothetical protein